MRLLNTRTLEIEEHFGIIPKYAILSHRWANDEVTFHDYTEGQFRTPVRREGWSKIVGSCHTANLRQLSYVWIDTCCIDKSSSAELTESINRMFSYYQNAHECYAFLDDVHKSIKSSSHDEIMNDMANSLWFTRGWTLQELIAPPRVIFFNSRWERLRTRNTISRKLQEITRVSWRLLQGKSALTDYSIAQRMSWAATRTTTRPEDEAYCLLGMFQVNMPMLYGEGTNAFRRLQEEIIKQSDDQTLFAWHDDRQVKPVLAPSVACFKDLHDLKCIYATNDARFGHTLSNSGLNIKLMLIPWAMDVYVAPLSCGRILANTQTAQDQASSGYSRMSIFLRRTQYENNYVRVGVEIGDQQNDFTMLDSKAVARKRDSFRIKDRQVFVRQLLFDVPNALHHSFTFSFHHPRMFRNGYTPTPSAEVLNRSFTQFPSAGDPNYCFIAERYSHHESAVFDISHLWPGVRSLYLRLGYDLNFVPVCLITTETQIDFHDGPEPSTMNELDGMHHSTDPVASLPWLLSKINAGKSAETLLAFKAKPSASTVVQCRKLSMSIDFQVRQTPTNIFGAHGSVRMWHVTFEPFISIPDAPMNPVGLSMAPPLSPGPRPTDSRLFVHGKSEKTWLGFVNRGDAKSRSSTWKIEDSRDLARFAPDSSLSADISHVSHNSAVTEIPGSSLSPGNVVISKRYSIETPIAHLISPNPVPPLSKTFREVISPPSEPSRSKMSEEIDIEMAQLAPVIARKPVGGRQVQFPKSDVVYPEVVERLTTSMDESRHRDIKETPVYLSSRITDVQDIGLTHFYQDLPWR